MDEEKKTYTTYLLLCADGSYYTGYARSLTQRIRCHNEGRGAKYTRSRRPVKLLASWTFSDRREAMRLEAAIKRLSHAQKKALSNASYSAKELEGLLALTPDKR